MTWIHVMGSGSQQVSIQTLQDGHRVHIATRGDRYTRRHEAFSRVMVESLQNPCAKKPSICSSAADHRREEHDLLPPETITHEHARMHRVQASKTD